MVIPASTQFKLPPPGFTLQKFVLYETRNRFFLVGSERTKTLFRVLKIDRTVTDTVSITEDNMLYNRHQIQELLTMIDDGNRSQGGLNKLCAAYGILGFIRFLHGYYLMLITSRRKVGKIGPNFIYGIDDIAYIYIPPSFPKTQTPELQEEMKYKGLFLGLDLTRDFYFSYTYDLTHTLQHNMTPDSHATVPPPPCEVLPPQEYQQSGEESTGKHSGNSSNSSSAHSSTANLNDIPKKIEPVNYELSGMFKKQSTKKKRQVETNPLPQSPPVTPKERPTPPYNDMFVWNNFLLEPLLSSVSSWDWILPIIHGYFIQSTVSIFGRPLSIVLIARRSRFFAGTRFLKRGLNEQGYVGNDVETEQILEDTEEENFTSYVQVRGSIPLFWFQDNSKMVPKPSIMMQRCDPYYASTILHFKDLFQRYGCPVTILNLVKSNEKRPRESILRDEFRDACKFINELLPASHKIVYCAWDFHQAAKNKESDHLGWLASFANQTLTTTKFFHSGAKLYSNILREEMKGHSHHSTSYASGQTQCGIVRTNCIDSLDRTNAAQFCIGMAALGQQLYAMGWADDQNIGFESEIVQLLIEMYEGLGNQIALQYGGSELANTIKTYTKNSLVSQTRDALTAVRRYYNNTFTDQEKQGSINLFLGYYVPWKAKEKVPLWELDTDYYLHNQQDNPVYMLVAYTDWWNNSNKFAQNNNNNNNNSKPHIPFVPPPPSTHASAPQIIATPSSASQIRHEWYQNNTHVFVSIFAKGVKKDQLNVDISEESLSVNIKLISGKEYVLDLELCDSVEVPQCTYEILSTKIEIKLKKTRQVKWDTLESTVPKEEKDKDGKKPNIRPWDAPTETKPAQKNWEKIVTESAGTEGLDDRDPQAKFWQDLFADASEEERRAIMKSYTESGGTVLNMNWGEVKKEKTKIYPPEGMEARSYSE
eukprot:TRINITY_DN2379_c0_g1_i4.p1 TRINITY_DN2379_c0_g1~~TRINITY_DN2379_c0_g1_i4.p1  ORF type:complete len:932 (-),score=227.25 TRINITY_DN2379_c0_g1_i4:192-2987(-)